jgi:hypothetical protein
VLEDREIIEWLNTEKEKRSIRWEDKLIKIKFKKGESVNPFDDKTRERLIDFAKKYSVLSLKSINGQYDLIRALVISHAALNEREVSEDDFKLLEMLENYLVDPLASNEPRIVAMRLEGKSVRDICAELGKDYESYKPYVHKVIKKAIVRGIIPKGGG